MCFYRYIPLKLKTQKLNNSVGQSRLRAKIHLKTSDIETEDEYVGKYPDTMWGRKIQDYNNLATLMKSNMPSSSSVRWPSSEMASINPKQRLQAQQTDKQYKWQHKGKLTAEPLWNGQ